MDKQFLEFWGNALLAAARGQQQLEDLAGWLSGDAGQSADLTSFFRQFSGLDARNEGTPAYLDAWQQSMDAFLKSLAEVLSLMDVVPRQDLHSLSRENEDLKQRIVEQEETIAHLRALLGEELKGPADSVRELRELIGEQARSYQDFMEGMGKAFGSTQAPRPTGVKAGRAKSRGKSGAAGKPSRSRRTAKG